ncbi:LysE family translocator [Lentzea sp. NBRC 105346]|uniref:LysE family translocator n=1 Tax=Lentzea sp. NBRC 105346 TaxID=3032205 RepID=UPI00249FB2BA|nr:LysE family transporter [Lentzea sp. NBRC 105346]GLZ27871.1 LysE family translocator [Lentzea sp. NBRC 105346]
MSNGIALGAVMGLGAGVSPGPLLTLVILASAKGGFAAGWRVAVAPLLTDVVIIVLTLTVLANLPVGVVGLIGLLGACLVAVIGVQTAMSSRTVELTSPDGGATEGVFRQAALVNFLSPHPWLFWATIGGPVVLTSWHEAPGGAVAFVACFYVLLVGSKTVLAGLVGGGRRWLNRKAYRTTVFCCGLAMVVFAVVLAVDSFSVAKTLLE